MGRKKNDKAAREYGALDRVMIVEAGNAAILSVLAGLLKVLGRDDLKFGTQTQRLVLAHAKIELNNWKKELPDVRTELAEAFLARIKASLPDGDEPLH